MENKSQVTRLIDLQELADQWRLSPHTIRAMVKQKRLHPTRISRRLLFSPQECERFLNSASEDKPSREEVAV